MSERITDTDLAGLEEDLGSDWTTLALVAEVRRLRDGIREHRTDSVELLNRPTTSIDLALWSLLD